MFAPILVAEILFTSSVIFPADVTGVLAIVNSDPDCVSPMLVTVPLLFGWTFWKFTATDPKVPVLSEVHKYIKYTHPYSMTILWLTLPV